MAGMHIVTWGYYKESVCICGYSFGCCTAFWCPQEQRPFWEAKQAHFKEAHPQLLADGLIA